MLKTYIESQPELAEFIASGNDGAIADWMNAKIIPAKGKLLSHDIRQYLMLVDLLLAIESTQTLTCISTKRALEIFPTFDLANPMILGKFTQILDGLVAEDLIPDFTEEHKATILSLADITISRAEEQGFSYVSSETVAKALRG